MAPLNPEHLFEQARKLTEPDAGRPRQADLRRAISAAYYGLFHAAVTAAADLVVGANNRSTNRYELVYRSADHKSLRGLCEDVSKQTMPAKFKPYVPQGGFGFDLKAFATAVVDLQEKRHAPWGPSFLLPALMHDPCALAQRDPRRWPARNRRPVGRHRNLEIIDASDLLDRCYLRRCPKCPRERREHAR